MPEKIQIPSTSELLETFRTSKQLKEKFPNKLWVIQPKFDGSKCVLIPTPSGYIATTGGGNKIECINSTLKKIDHQLADIPFEDKPVFETEIEPEPWTHENKAKLSGNLYNQVDLPFNIKLSAFDCISQTDFQNQTASGQVFSSKTGKGGRVEALDKVKDRLQEAGVRVSKHEILTTEEIADIMDKGIEDGKAKHRVIWGDLEIEGWVIRAPEATFVGGKRTAQAIKLKPFVSLDLLVVVAAKKANGTAALGCVDTKEPGQPYYLFTGLPKNMQQDPTTMLGKIVEVEILTTDDIKKGMGNPTYKNERPDKSFNGTVEQEVLNTIKKKIATAGLVVVGETDKNLENEISIG